MAKLDELVRGEFRQALNQNYGFEPVGEFREDVKRVISNIPSLIDEDVDTIKQITKAGSFVIPELDNDSLLNLVRYNAEGAHKTKSEKKEITAEIVESHFDGHVSKVAHELFARSQNKSWLEISYDSVIRSAKKAEGTDVRHSAFSFAIASERAKTLHELTNKLDYLVGAERFSSTAAKIFEDFDENRAASCHFHGAEISRKIYEFTNDTEWLKKEFTHRRTCAEINDLIKSDLTDSSFESAAVCAKEMYDRTKRTTWLTSFYEMKFASAESAKKLDKPFAKYIYTYAGNAARDLFHATKNKDWLKKYHECYVASAQLAESTDPLHAGHAHMFAGNAASDLFRETKEFFWRENATRHYQRAIYLMEANNVSSQTIHNLKRSIERL